MELCSGSRGHLLVGDVKMLSHGLGSGCHGDCLFKFAFGIQPEFSGNLSRAKQIQNTLVLSSRDTERPRPPQGCHTPPRRESDSAVHPAPSALGGAGQRPAAPHATHAALPGSCAREPRPVPAGRGEGRTGEEQTHAPQSGRNGVVLACQPHLGTGYWPE